MASSGSRLRHLSRILRGEREVSGAVRRSLDVLLASAAKALRASGYDTAVLDGRLPGWRQALDSEVGPAVLRVFTEAWDATSRLATIDPEPYATRHLESVWNRLVGVSDEVFDTMRLTLEEGRRNQESIADLATRVDLLLSDDQRWTNRAVTIARTEVIGANNAGATASAGATAAVLGTNPAEVVKEWMATSDGRTRPSHAEADGQQVMGLATPFSVGGADLDHPGDPAGPGEEVINCRCTLVFIYPGDPDYPSTLSAGNTSGDLPRYPGTPPGSTADAEQAARLAPAAAAPVPAVAMAREPVVDTGPANQMEANARGLTIQELQAEATRGTAAGKKAARAELRRRGVAASAAATQEDTMHRHPITAAIGDDHEGDTTVWVALLPTPDDPVQSIGTEDPKHCTLLFLGEAATLPPDAQAVLSGQLEAYAAAAGDITAPVTGVESLGDEGARVWMLGGDSVSAFRDGLLTPEVSPYLDNGEQYPSFTPHVTIGYPPDPDEATEVEPEDPNTPEPPETDVAPALDDATEQAAAAVQSITFDRLALWWAGAETIYDLGPEADDGTPPEVQAALALVRDAGYTVGLTSYAEGDQPPATDVQPVPTTEPPATASDIAPDGHPFYGIMWPENVQSGDGRGIDAGATTWRDLPLPLMAQDATMPGHDGAVRVGRIDTMERDETTYSVPVIRYAGVWDTSAAAVETERQVENGVVRGVSTDGDAVTVELRGSDGEVLDPMTDDFPEDGIVLEVATAARISGGTVCSVPAFHQAYVANGTLADRTEPEPGWNADGTPKDNTIDQGAAPVEGEAPLPLVASVAGGPARMAPTWALTAGASVLPVVEGHYFANPTLTEPTPLTVDDDGRVYGHLATWGTCHIGIDGYCQEPPVSASNYAYFAKGAVLTDTGERLRVGPLTMGTGHANMGYGYRAAAEHYDNTGTVVADIAIGQDAVGIWFSGRIRPTATEAQVYALAAAGAVSGDWREVVRHSGDLELVAALVVNTPGFALPRPAVAASAADGLALVAAGMVPPRREAPVMASAAGVEVQAIAREVLATLDRRERARVAASRLETRREVRRAERVTVARSRLSERV